MDINSLIRRVCPNYMPMKKLMARIKIRQVNERLIPEKIILNCENSEPEKQTAIEKYAKNKNQYVQKDIKEINNLIKQGLITLKEKEDMTFCLLAYGFKPTEYLSFRLQEKSTDERKKYISNTDRLIYIFKMNDVIDYGVFKDKWFAYEKLKPYYLRESIFISNENDFQKFVEFITKHPVFVKKRVNMSWGESIDLIDSSEKMSSPKDLFDSLIKDGKHILEERIIQSSEMMAINASSVNTIRCSTFYTLQGVEIGWCFLRAGRDGSFVDNGSAGGIEAGIDINTGRIDTDGYDHYGRQFISHPDSGVIFNGYQLPEFDQMLSICKEMALLFPTIKFIGWDMAFTQNGWCVIEGNGTSQFMGPQICYKKGIKVQVEEIMSRMNLLV